VDSRGCYLDVLPIAEQPAEKAFRHWAPANISRTNEEDAFHDFKAGALPTSQGKIKPNQVNARGRMSAKFCPGGTSDISRWCQPPVLGNEGASPGRGDGNHTMQFHRPSGTRRIFHPFPVVITTG
jgi:hypothetical protein